MKSHFNFDEILHGESSSRNPNFDKVWGHKTYFFIDREYVDVPNYCPVPIRQYLNKEKELEDIIENISIKTRQYAKRQSTWARGHMNTWLKLKPKELNNFLKKI
mgnify:CR=1 FL=1